MISDDAMVYFLIDRDSFWYLGERFWVFESYLPELVMALDLLTQTAFLSLGWSDYYIVSKKFQWLIGFNHHDIISCIGEGLNINCFTNKMIWDSSTYVWFYLNNIPGGTDVYFYQHSDLEIAFLKEELQVNPNFRKYQRIIERNLYLGYRWSFRRSVGQPGIITLSYGFLAVSLAKLTEGVLYSDDGAWDYKKFPADPDDFMQWYFRLECMDEQSDMDFHYVKESLKSIQKA